MTTIIDANWSGYNLILAKTKNNFENKKILLYHPIYYTKWRCWYLLWSYDRYQYL